MKKGIAMWNWAFDNNGRITTGGGAVIGSTIGAGATLTAGILNYNLGKKQLNQQKDLYNKKIALSIDQLGLEQDNKAGIVAALSGEKAFQIDLANKAFENKYANVDWNAKYQNDKKAGLLKNTNIVD